MIGPRESERLWERHILNSALLGDAIPQSVSVIDVGSGAGLPGIPLAITRPDLQVTLVEPLARRVTFLEEVVADLGLSDRVQVVRARAEEASPLQAQVITARAVANLSKLITWCWPLVAAGGQLLLLKGEQAEAEITEATNLLRKKRLQAEMLVQGEGEQSIRLVRVSRIRAATSPDGTLATGKAGND